MTRIPPRPTDGYGGAWAELTGYVQQAQDDGGTISPENLLTFMAELRRDALKPIREWMELIQSTPEDKLPSLGQVGYENYGDFTAWKNYQGKPMPQWADLPVPIKGAWQAAANEIATLIIHEMPSEGDLG